MQYRIEGGSLPAVIINMNPGEQLICDTGVVALMDTTCTMDIRLVKGAKNLLLGGEGVVDTVITGPGKVCLQTMSVPKLAKLLIPFLPKPEK